MEIKILFDNAVEESKNLTSKPGNDALLQLYALYKQSTVGDVNVDPPSNTFDFVSKAKYEARVALKGMPTEQARQEYINLVEKLKVNS